MQCHPAAAEAIVRAAPREMLRSICRFLGVLVLLVTMGTAVLTAGQRPAAAMQLAGPDLLAAWHAGLEIAGSEPADVLFIGNSITEGYGTPSRADWWLEIVRERLQASWGGGGIGYTPVVSAFPGPFPAGVWTTSGGETLRTDGLGLRSYLLNTPAAFAQAAVTTDGVELFYGTGPSSGAMRVSVDGQVAVVVDTYDAAGDLGVGTWRSGPLLHGLHTIRVEPVATGTVPVYAVQLEGSMVFDGDDTSGARVWDSGHSGFTTAHFADNLAWTDSVPAVDPDLVVIELASNDMNKGISVPAFEANLGQIIDAVIAGSSSPPSIVLMPVWRQTSQAPAIFQSYVDAQRRVAEQRGLAIVDLTALDASLFTYDGIHASALGNRAIADAVLTVIDPRYTPIAVASAPSAVGATLDPVARTATMRWTAPPEATNQYVVRGLDVTTGLPFGADQTVTAQTATFTALAPGHQYVFSVFAGNEVGYSASGQSSPVTMPSAPPRPVGVTAALSAPRSVAVAWTPSTVPVTGYVVAMFDLTTGTSRYVSQQSVTDTTATFVGLTQGGRYSFQVYARNEMGSSLPGSTSSIVIPAPPPRPTGVTAALQATPRSVVVTWARSPVPVTGYVVAMFDVTTGTSRHVSQQSVIGTTATFSGLTLGSRYTFQVYARNAVGSSLPGGSSTIAIPAPPPPPVGVVATGGLIPGTVTVIWTPSLAPVTGYAVAIFDVTTSTSVYVTQQSVALPVATFTGLVPGRRYIFSVYAKNAAGYSLAGSSPAITVSLLL
jgi:lysophospholipase L1-like esterase/surface antigen